MILRPAILALIACLAVVIAVGCTTTSGTSIARDDGTPKAGVNPYPFDWCAVARTPLRDRNYRRVRDGQEILFCCKPCVMAYEANPDIILNNIRTEMRNQGIAIPESSVAGADVDTANTDFAPSSINTSL